MIEYYYELSTYIIIVHAYTYWILLKKKKKKARKKRNIYILWWTKKCFQGTDKNFIVYKSDNIWHFIMITKFFLGYKSKGIINYALIIRTVYINSIFHITIFWMQKCKRRKIFSVYSGKNICIEKITCQFTP